MFSAGLEPLPVYKCPSLFPHSVLCMGTMGKKGKRKGRKPDSNEWINSTASSGSVR